jgi:hypothetical protein
MFLYVYVSICVISVMAMWLPSPGYLQDSHGGHKIGDACLLLVSQ